MASRSLQALFGDRRSYTAPSDTIKFRNNEVRLRRHGLAYNLATFRRTLALPREVEHWSLTTIREKPVKIGAKVVAHGRYVTFQMAEVAVPHALLSDILQRIDRLRRPTPATA